MLKIENTEVLGWEAAIRGLRNPMNSWAKSDSGKGNGHGLLCKNCHSNCQFCSDDIQFTVGPNDHKLMMNLAKAGSTDAKYRRMINVTADVTAPLYWWKEYDTYKVSTVANSCSTMHKIQAKEFTRDDFSCEHLIEYGDPEEVPVIAVGEGLSTIENEIRRFWPSDILDLTISMLNRSRQMFLETKDKRFWYQMIQLLPSSYNQRRTIQLNYEVLAAIYPKRKNHKLDEWHTFCDWIRSLPYSEIITLEDNNVQETF